MIKFKTDKLKRCFQLGAIICSANLVITFLLWVLLYDPVVLNIKESYLLSEGEGFLSGKKIETIEIKYFDDECLTEVANIALKKEFLEIKDKIGVDVYPYNQSAKEQLHQNYDELTTGLPNKQKILIQKHLDNIKKIQNFPLSSFIPEFVPSLHIKPKTLFSEVLLNYNYPHDYWSKLSDEFNYSTLRQPTNLLKALHESSCKKTKHINLFFLSQTINTDIREFFKLYTIWIYVNMVILIVSLVVASRLNKNIHLDN